MGYEGTLLDSLNRYGLPAKSCLLPKKHLANPKPSTIPESVRIPGCQEQKWTVIKIKQQTKEKRKAACWKAQEQCSESLGNPETWQAGPQIPSCISGRVWT